MKKLTLLLLLLLPGGKAMFAQTAHRDSVIEIARADAEKFKLNDTDLSKFRLSRPGRGNSDFFKPVAANVSDTTLLRDSDYVKAYRRVAFIKTRKRHPASHYILLSGIIAAGVIIVTSVAIVLIHGV